MKPESKIYQVNMTQLKQLVEAGHTDAFIAEFFCIHPRTLAYWKIKDARFGAAYKNWKKTADEKVERALFERAVGDGWLIPADVNACKYWLNNRKPQEWKEKSTQEITGKLDLNTEVKISLEERAAMLIEEGLKDD